VLDCICGLVDGGLAKRLKCQPERAAMVKVLLGEMKKRYSDFTGMVNHPEQFRDLANITRYTLKVHFCGSPDFVMYGNGS
jgi:hypothetical protein